MSSSIIAQISFDDGVSFESILVVPLDSEAYRLDETPLTPDSPIAFGDVIEAKKDEAGRLLFRRIISKAEYQTQQWFVSQQVLESPEFKDFCNSVLKSGGMWELALGGSLIIHMPQGVDFNPRAEIDKLNQIVISKQ